LCWHDQQSWISEFFQLKDAEPELTAKMAFVMLARQRNIIMNLSCIINKREAAYFISRRHHAN
jgi:hypothetical protein